MNDSALSGAPRAHTHWYRAYSMPRFRASRYWAKIPAEQQEAIVAMSQVLPFRVNDYVLQKLIDWDAVPDDPLYRLVFPHSDMLDPELYGRLRFAAHQGDSQALAELVRTIRLGLNPHPAGQVEANVPFLDEGSVDGMQHKYKQTVLLFPANGQTCHAYCSFCFRWPQFVDEDIHKFRLRSADATLRYLADRRDVTDVLVTGGDPMIMSVAKLQELLAPILTVEHVQAIRIGTKAVSFWPYRFFADADADELMALFENIVRSGRHLGIMLHVNHPREIGTAEAARAIARIRDTGAVIRIQAPLIRHVNDGAEVWAQLWQEAVRQGCFPYYMFVTRDTGPQPYFRVSLAKAHKIYSDAIKSLSGLARTARGPVMSCYWGKIVVDGVTELMHAKYFVLRFLQARDDRYPMRPFLAKYREDAYWIDDLAPAFNEHFDLGDGIKLDPRTAPRNKEYQIELA